MTGTIGLGGGHCCACAVVCMHIGGPWYCDDHKPQRAMSLPTVPVVPSPALGFNRLRMLDFNAVRRHVAEYRRAWAENSNATETYKTVAAVLCAEDLAVLLDHLDEPVSLDRLPHTCAGDPDGTCDACDVAEDAAAVRREDR